MLSINEARLLGWVGIVNPHEEGKPLRFTLATKRSWKDRESGDLRTETTWHRVTVFQPPAPLLKRLAKGARVWVDGRIRTSEYERNGEKRTGTEIVAPAARVEVLAAAPAPEAPPPPDQSWQARPAQDADGPPY